MEKLGDGRNGREFLQLPRPPSLVWTRTIACRVVCRVKRQVRDSIYSVDSLPPCCPHAKEILPDLQLPKQTSHQRNLTVAPVAVRPFLGPGGLHSKIAKTTPLEGRESGFECPRSQTPPVTVISDEFVSQQCGDPGFGLWFTAFSALLSSLSDDT